MHFAKIKSFFERPFIGRVTQRQYFLSTLLNFIAIVVLLAFIKGSHAGALAAGSYFLVAIPFWIVYLACCVLLLLIIYFACGLAVRRFHDLDCSGYAVALAAIPVVTIAFFLAVWLLPGEETANGFGHRTSNKNIFHIILNEDTRGHHLEKWIIPLVVVVEILIIAPHFSSIF